MKRGGEKKNPRRRAKVQVGGIPLQGLCFRYNWDWEAWVCVPVAVREGERVYGHNVLWVGGKELSVPSLILSNLSALVSLMESLRSF